MYTRVIDISAAQLLPKLHHLVRGNSGVRNLWLLLSMSSGKKHCRRQFFLGGNFYGNIENGSWSPWSLYTEPLNGAQPSISNLLANTKALPANTEATKSSNGAQLSITNLPANTETMSNTQHRNSLTATNKENMSNKSGHSTTSWKYLNTSIIT